ncbi:hypothetical protein J4E91_000457 [Alternaria rosae]|nr:hypothetical protein J4E91_000457 [Alternaria rosae]
MVDGGQNLEGVLAKEINDEIRLDRGDIDKFRDKAIGLEKEGEKIKLKLVWLTELWWEGARDSKVLTALSLYENLKREEELPSMPDDIGREVNKGGSGEVIQKAAAVFTM